MSLSNILQQNNENIYCDTLNCNNLNVSAGSIYSFATNGNTTGNIGFPAAQPYNLYVHVIGKYAICYFDLPPINLIATSGVFNIPYPAQISPPSGNVDTTTAFGNASVIGSDFNHSGTSLLYSGTFGAQFITCFWNVGNTGTVQIRGSFVVNFN